MQHELEKPHPSDRLGTVFARAVLLLLAVGIVVAIVGAIVAALVSSGHEKLAEPTTPTATPTLDRLVAERDKKEAADKKREGLALPLAIEAPVELAPAITFAPISEDDIKALTAEREHLNRVLKSIDAMLTTRAFIDRARIYCRSQVAATPLGKATVEDMENSYAKLEHQESRPDPYKLQAMSDAISYAYRNMSDCQQMIANGWQALPTDEQERQRAQDSKDRLVAIDQEFKFAPRK